MTQSPGDPATTLYRDGRVRAPHHPGATALLVRGGALAWVGADPSEVAARGRRGRRPGRRAGRPRPSSTPTCTPPRPGWPSPASTSPAPTSLADCLRQVEAAGRSARGGVVLGHGWDETTWPEHRAPTRQELDRASYGGVVYLSRVDVHSAVVSSALLAAVPEVRGEPTAGRSPGTSPGQPTTSYAGSRASRSRPAQRRGAPARHPDAAAELGIAPAARAVRPGHRRRRRPRRRCWSWPPRSPARTSSATGARPPRSAASTGPGSSAPGAPPATCSPTARSARTPRRCATRTPTPTHTGHGYLDAAEVRDHVVACTEAGLQAGFHAIGDGALDAVVAGIDEAAERLGADRLRAARHRIEHVEMLAPEHLPVLARLGVVASVQPAFDRLWGGESGMYAERLGLPRALSLNPFAAMAASRHRAGARVGLAGHAAGPVGQRPRRGPAPDRRIGARPGRRVRRAHPGRLAGRRPGRRRGGDAPARRPRSPSGTSTSSTRPPACRRWSPATTCRAACAPSSAGRRSSTATGSG